MKLFVPVFISLMTIGSYAIASDTKTEFMIPIHAVSTQGIGEKIGYVTVTETERGIQLKPDLRDLPPGSHGFHVHENPSCAPQLKEDEMKAAGAAGNHYDPNATGKHSAPWGKDGHLGDLPTLSVTTTGVATQPVIAPRLTLNDLHNRALVIHAGADNYSDYPEPLGGGGDRIACGVIKSTP